MRPQIFIADQRRSEFIWVKKSAAFIYEAQSQEGKELGPRFGPPQTVAAQFTNLSY